MTRLTNTTNLPAPLYRALLADDYDSGNADITATGLIAPPRLGALMIQHENEISEDIADMARLLIGKAVHFYIWYASVRDAFKAVIASAHDVIESPTPSALLDLGRAVKAWGAGLLDLNDNKRLGIKVNGWLVTGQTDHVFVHPDGSVELLSTPGHHIRDYKTMGTHEWTRGLRSEREEQLNVYAELLRANGFPVSSLGATCIFVDWSPRTAKYEKDYPPSSIVDVDVPLWSQEKAQTFIYERVLLHQAARADVESALCTDDERWARGGGWAVMKKGNTRSTKNLVDYDEAVALRDEVAAAHPKDVYTVEAREREYGRCEFYCRVAQHCAQWAGDGGGA